MSQRKLVKIHIDKTNFLIFRLLIFFHISNSSQILNILIKKLEVEGLCEKSLNNNFGLSFYFLKIIYLYFKYK